MPNIIWDVSLTMTVLSIQNNMKTYANQIHYRYMHERAKRNAQVDAVTFGTKYLIKCLDTQHMWVCSDGSHEGMQ